MPKRIRWETAVARGLTRHGIQRGTDSQRAIMLRYRETLPREQYLRLLSETLRTAKKPQ